MKFLVTGGCGFLGSHFVRHVLHQPEPHHVTNVDLLTYAGDPQRLADIHSARYTFVQSDITDGSAMRALTASARPDVVVHFAAESHVTRSESRPDHCFVTNVDGTATMLETSESAGVRRFIHISTDEVYGSIDNGTFGEQDKRQGAEEASSPYSKSKALADDLARAHEGDMDVVVIRPTNCFGPWQHPEKALPRWIIRGLSDATLPVWGDGLYVRQWLYAHDLALAVSAVIERGEAGSAYNVGPRHDPEITNIALAHWLLEYLKLEEGKIVFTAYDRPGHDRRYSVDPARIEMLDWRPGDVWKRLAETVEWYRGNRSWWAPLVPEAEVIYDDGHPANA